MICSNCGKEISDGSKFCVFCGGTQQTEMPTEAVMQQPVPPMQQPVPPMQQPVPPMQQPVPPVQQPVPPMQQPVPPVQQPIPPMQQPVPPMQQPVPPMQQPVPPVQQPKKKSKAGLIVALVLLVLLLAGGGVFAFMWVNRPVTKVADAFAENDIEQVVELYEKVNDNDKAEIEAQAKTYAIDMVDSYLSGTEDVDYETLSETLEALCEDILKDDEDVEDKVQIAEAVNESREAFEMAEEYRTDGDYQEALAFYAEVIEEDEACYDDAQEAITEVEDTVRSEAIAEAEEYASDNDYQSARAVLECALVILPDDTELTDAMTAIDDAEVQAEIDDVMDYVERGEYSEAINMLESALEEYPDNSALTTALEEVSAEMYAANPLLGEWGMQLDISDIMAEEMEIDAENIETAFVVNLIFKFEENGEYMIYVDEDGYREMYTVWMEECVDYVIQEMCDENGITLDEMDEMFVEMYGMSVEEYLDAAIEEDMDEFVDDAISSMQMGGYYETEGEKLYLYENSIDYSVYDLFSIEGNTLTISLEEGVEFESTVPGLGYPFVLTRE